MAEDEEKTAFAGIMDRLAKELMPPEEQPTVTAKAVEATAKAMISKGYEITTRTLEVLVDYLKGYNVWLCGNVGTGKTFFFECMSKVRADKGLDPIRKLSMIETMAWTMDQAREWLDDSEGFDIVIDDVGTEPEMNNYGVRAELFPYILERRMEVWRRRTHMTSNLGPADILKRYDRRVADRFTEMFKLEKLESKKSRRHLSPWKKATASGLL